MNAHDIIESYVRDVASCLPRSKRNDVAFELRALLNDELTANAQSASRAPDKAMVMDLLKGFGRPAEAAARYHPRPALIDPADTHHFLIWTLAGAVFVTVRAALESRHTTDSTDLFLQWLGILVVIFSLMAWWRRRNPNVLRWKPKRDPESMPRALALLALAATLFFPVFMYAAPQTFVRIAFFNAIPNDGVALADSFRHSPLRITTLALLSVQAAHFAIVTIQGRWQPWLGWTSAIAHGLLGLALIAHAAPPSATPGLPAFPIFESAKATLTASPIFACVGGFMLLCSFYEMFREWSRITPAPTLEPQHA